MEKIILTFIITVKEKIMLAHLENTGAVELSCFGCYKNFKSFKSNKGVRSDTKVESEWLIDGLKSSQRQLWLHL